MNVKRSIRSALVKWALAFNLWTIIGLSFASQFYVSSAQFGNPISWLQAMTWSLCDWYVWALLSIPILRFARLFRLERGRWGKSIVIHLAASATFSFIYIFLRAWIGQWQSSVAGQNVTFAQTFNPLLVKTFHFNLLVYWVIISVSHSVDYYRKYQEREVRAADLERRLAQARLQALQMQLNPHFLFNTLHAISALMHKDIDAADRMIIRLSDLLRYTLESTEEHEVSLRQELAFLDLYLDIEKTRFGPRLTITKNIDPATLEAQVPNLILQPLMENAVRHGIEPHARPGRIDLSTIREGNTLQIRVRDNGGGVTPGEPVSEGVGLANTRSRLQQLYRNHHTFTLGNASEGGFLVTLTIPFQTTATLSASKPSPPEIPARRRRPSPAAIDPA